MMIDEKLPHHCTLYCTGPEKYSFLGKDDSGESSLAMFRATDPLKEQCHGSKILNSKMSQRFALKL